MRPRASPLARPRSDRGEGRLLCRQLVNGRRAPMRRTSRSARGQLGGDGADPLP
ncbi:hypothetical protein [Dactylosporangium sp. NPDC048998]|uniref:hypothetical protein n=1 Tax=Dactylosporangium sp. NPDC048998 TaxID=3363976 RepID=UPI003720E224